MGDTIRIKPILFTDVDTVYGPFESSSRPDLKHYVFEWHTDEYKVFCTCEGWKYRQHCKHVDSIKDDYEEGGDFDVSL